ncbi:MAG: hypothetical protein CMF61_04000 [Magnetococcales bacterium]|nr:hypothetical protein [Magnetococcales bacterium]|tara:strand:- start:164 stop:388 length:225 start_codon:yes stop_codon:yes gene_type:complete
MPLFDKVTQLKFDCEALIKEAYEYPGVGKYLSGTSQATLLRRCQKLQDAKDAAGLDALKALLINCCLDLSKRKK